MHLELNRHLGKTADSNPKARSPAAIPAPPKKAALVVDGVEKVFTPEEPGLTADCKKLVQTKPRATFSSLEREKHYPPGSLGHSARKEAWPGRPLDVGRGTNEG